MKKAKPTKPTKKMPNSNTNKNKKVSKSAKPATSKKVAKKSPAKAAKKAKVAKKAVPSVKKTEARLKAQALKSSKAAAFHGGSDAAVWVDSVGADREALDLHAKLGHAENQFGSVGA